MSEDLTKKTSDPDGDLFSQILTIVRKLDSNETILTQIFDRLGKHETILTQILDRLTELESRVDAETRVGVVETRLHAIGGGLHVLEKTLKRSVHHLDRGQSVLNDAILKINIGFLDINERLQSLEPQHKPTNSST